MRGKNPTCVGEVKVRAVSHIIRHYLPLTALVHTYIPQMRTPCGCKAHGVLGSLISLSWATVVLPLLPFTLHIYYTTF